MITIPLTEMPLIEEGDDVARLVLKSLEAQSEEVEDGDVLVVAQTIVSKAEGNVIDLSSVDPTPRAERMAEKMGKDPRKIEVVLGQTAEIVRADGALITETKHGFVCADAGVDGSNVGPGRVTLLPDDPDESAGRIKDKIERETGRDIAVIVSDSWGRPFRRGAVGFAIGIAGLKPLVSLVGKEDLYERPLESTEIAPPDALAAVASLEMGEANESIPAVLIKGAKYEGGNSPISGLMRSRENDLFR